VYPALAVLKALQDDENSTWKSDEKEKPSSSFFADLEVLWVGGEGGIEIDLLSDEEITLKTIPAAGVHGVGLRVLPRNLWQIIKGFFSARRIILKFQPNVMFFTGGYLAVPVALAGRLILKRNHRPKILLYVPDIEPGLALRTLARLSDQIALTVEDSMNYFEFQSKLQVTGYPVRPDLKVSDRAYARRMFNLVQDLPTLLVFGGSKGARSINRAMIKSLPDLLVEMQVIHISGHLDWNEIEVAQENLPFDLKSRYHPYPYLYQEMGAALSIADLVVSRSGASVLGEFPLFGLPAILVPYPYAWRYQEVNARYLERSGAAVVIQDSDLNRHLSTTIRELMDDQNRRKNMGQSMVALTRPKAAESIANLLHGLVSMPTPGRI
jgi:UDP-N-acetylglucosamine--N-acetylmuramyl-(pentapeptide) pyrophosphoryl-undecaprenol N-acetylglucosamine transferase